MNPENRIHNENIASDTWYVIKDCNTVHHWILGLKLQLVLSKLKIFIIWQVYRD